jgi:hypothetical protein
MQRSLNYTEDEGDMLTETSLTTYKRQIPEDHNPYFHQRENLKSQSQLMTF